MKKIILAACFCFFSSTAAFAYRPNDLPYTQGSQLEFIQKDYSFKKPEILNTIGTVLTSFYGHNEKLNKYTSSGQVFNSNKLTAAHRSLPFGTRLLVQYRGKSVVVTVNDRGPNIRLHRDLDLSYGAAKVLGIDKIGVAVTRITIIK